MAGAGLKTMEQAGNSFLERLEVADRRQSLLEAWLEATQRGRLHSQDALESEACRDGGGKEAPAPDPEAGSIKKEGASASTPSSSAPSASSDGSLVPQDLSTPSTPRSMPPGGTLPPSTPRSMLGGAASALVPPLPRTSPPLHQPAVLFDISATRCAPAVAEAGSAAAGISPNVSSRAAGQRQYSRQDPEPQPLAPFSLRAAALYRVQGAHSPGQSPTLGPTAALVPTSPYNQGQALGLGSPRGFQQPFGPLNLGPAVLASPPRLGHMAPHAGHALPASPASPQLLAGPALGMSQPRPGELLPPMGLLDGADITAPGLLTPSLHSTLERPRATPAMIPPDFLAGPRPWHQAPPPLAPDANSAGHSGRRTVANLEGMISVPRSLSLDSSCAPVHSTHLAIAGNMTQPENGSLWAGSGEQWMQKAKSADVPCRAEPEVKAIPRVLKRCSNGIVALEDVLGAGTKSCRAPQGEEGGRGDGGTQLAHLGGDTRSSAPPAGPEPAAPKPSRPASPTAGLSRPGTPMVGLSTLHADATLTYGPTGLPEPQSCPTLVATVEDASTKPPPAGKAWAGADREEGAAGRQGSLVPVQHEGGGSNRRTKGRPGKQYLGSMVYLSTCLRLHMAPLGEHSQALLVPEPWPINFQHLASSVRLAATSAESGTLHLACPLPLVQAYVFLQQLLLDVFFVSLNVYREPFPESQARGASSGTAPGTGRKLFSGFALPLLAPLLGQVEERQGLSILEGLLADYTRAASATADLTTAEYVTGRESSSTQIHRTKLMAWTALCQKCQEGPQEQARHEPAECARPSTSMAVRQKAPVSEDSDTPPYERMFEAVARVLVALRRTELMVWSDSSATDMSEQCSRMKLGVDSAVGSTSLHQKPAAEQGWAGLVGEMSIEMRRALFEDVNAILQCADSVLDAPEDGLRGYLETAGNLCSATLESSQGRHALDAAEKGSEAVPLVHSAVAVPPSLPSRPPGSPRRPRTSDASCDASSRNSGSPRKGGILKGPFTYSQPLQSVPQTAAEASVTESGHRKRNHDKRALKCGDASSRGWDLEEHCESRTRDAAVQGQGKQVDHDSAVRPGIRHAAEMPRPKAPCALQGATTHAGWPASPNLFEPPSNSARSRPHTRKVPGPPGASLGPSTPKAPGPGASLLRPRTPQPTGSPGPSLRPSTPKAQGQPPGSSVRPSTPKGLALNGSSLRPGTPKAPGSDGSALRPTTPKARGPPAFSLQPATPKAPGAYGSSMQAGTPKAPGHSSGCSMRPSTPKAPGLHGSLLRPSTPKAPGPPVSTMRPRTPRATGSRASFLQPSTPKAAGPSGPSTRPRSPRPPGPPGSPQRPSALKAPEAPAPALRPKSPRVSESLQVPRHSAVPTTAHNSVRPASSRGVREPPTIKHPVVAPEAAPRPTTPKVGLVAQVDQTRKAAQVAAPERTEGAGTPKASTSLRHPSVHRTASGPSSTSSAKCGAEAFVERSQARKGALVPHSPIGSGSGSGMQLGSSMPGTSHLLARPSKQHQSPMPDPRVEQRSMREKHPSTRSGAETGSTHSHAHSMTGGRKACRAEGETRQGTTSGMAALADTRRSTNDETSETGTEGLAAPTAKAVAQTSVLHAAATPPQGLGGEWHGRGNQHAGHATERTAREAGSPTQTPQSRGRVLPPDPLASLGPASPSIRPASPAVYRRPLSPASAMVTFPEAHSTGPIPGHARAARLPSPDARRPGSGPAGPRPGSPIGPTQDAPRLASHGSETRQQACVAADKKPAVDFSVAPRPAAQHTRIGRALPSAASAHRPSSPGSTNRLLPRASGETEASCAAGPREMASFHRQHAGAGGASSPRMHADTRPASPAPEMPRPSSLTREHVQYGGTGSGRATPRGSAPQSLRPRSPSATSSRTQSLVAKEQGRMDAVSRHHRAQPPLLAPGTGQLSPQSTPRRQEKAPAGMVQTSKASSLGQGKRRPESPGPAWPGTPGGRRSRDVEGVETMASGYSTLIQPSSARAHQSEHSRSGITSSALKGLAPPSVLGSSAVTGEGHSGSEKTGQSGSEKTGHSGSEKAGHSSASIAPSRVKVSRTRDGLSRSGESLGSPSARSSSSSSRSFQSGWSSGGLSLRSSSNGSLRSSSNGSLRSTSGASLFSSSSGGARGGSRLGSSQAPHKPPLPMPGSHHVKSRSSGIIAGFQQTL